MGVDRAPPPLGRRHQLLGRRVMAVALAATALLVAPAYALAGNKPARIRNGKNECVGSLPNGHELRTSQSTCEVLEVAPCTSQAANADLFERQSWHVSPDGHFTAELKNARTCKCLMARGAFDGRVQACKCDSSATGQQYEYEVSDELNDAGYYDYEIFRRQALAIRMCFFPGVCEYSCFFGLNCDKVSCPTEDKYFVGLETGCGALNTFGIDFCSIDRVCGDGTCSQYGWGYYCACDSATADDNCEEEIDPCLTEACATAANAECLRTGAVTAQCRCMPNYEGDPNVGCTEKNLCLQENGGCDANALCMPVPANGEKGPSVECECKDGLYGTGFQCCDPAPCGNYTLDAQCEVSVNGTISTESCLRDDGCKPARWGKECDKECACPSYAAPGACHDDTGDCTGACADGWEGTDCSTKKPAKDGSGSQGAMGDKDGAAGGGDDGGGLPIGIIAGAAGGGVLLIAIIALLVVRQRRREGPGGAGAGGSKGHRRLSENGNTVGMVSMESLEVPRATRETTNAILKQGGGNQAVAGAYSSVGGLGGEQHYESMGGANGMVQYTTVGFNKANSARPVSATPHPPPNEYATAAYATAGEARGETGAEAYEPLRSSQNMEDVAPPAAAYEPLRSSQNMEDVAPRAEAYEPLRSSQNLDSDSRPTSQYSQLP